MDASNNINNEIKIANSYFDSSNALKQFSKMNNELVFGDLSKSFLSLLFVMKFLVSDVSTTMTPK